jgi:hypothetical protein
MEAAVSFTIVKEGNEEYKALNRLAGALAGEGCPLLPAINRLRRQLLLFVPEAPDTAAPALVITYRDGRYVWGDPERSYTEDEMEEAAKEIAYFVASEGV